MGLTEDDLQYIDPQILGIAMGAPYGPLFAGWDFGRVDG